MFANVRKTSASRLGKLVVDKGWVSAAQLDMALNHQVAHQCKLGESLQALELIDNYQLKVALRRQTVLRSIVASCVMATTPVCPALAGDKGHQSIGAVPQSKPLGQDSRLYGLSKINNQEVLPSWQQPSHDERFLKESNVFELKVGNGVSFYQFEQTDLYVPNLPLSQASRNGAPTGLLTRTTFKNSQRFDRYKNTQPAVYRLTVKGFSLLEKCNDKLTYGDFSRVKDYPYKRYELMFSIRKDF